ncbi:MAG: thiol reductant ABC exporter subunit CydC [Marmoricola sp.]
MLSQRAWLLLDEPTAHLDPVTRRILLDVIVEESKTRGVVVVTHDRETVNAADRVISLSPALPESLVRSPAEPTPAPVRPDQEVGHPAATPGFGLSTLLGSLSSVSGIALTATAGWLIVKAADQPPVLTMLVAIVGVRTFGLARPVLRYLERLRSHDAALALLARRRVEVYDSLVPLTPGRLGKRRGDVLASIVDDVDATLDRALRVRLPLHSYLTALLVTGGIAIALSPAAGVVIASTSVVGAAAGYLITRAGCASAEDDAVATRALLSASVLDVANLASELRMWQAGDRAVTEVDRIGARLAASSRRVAHATSAARAGILVSVAAGLIGSATLLGPQVSDGAISGPIAALLCLLPIALGDVALGVVEAGALAGRVRRAEARLASYAAMPPAVTEPVRSRPASAHCDLSGERLSLGWVGRPVLTDLDVGIAEGAKVAVVGPSGSGKSTLAATLVRFIDPLDGSVTLGGVGLADLGLDTVRERIGFVDDDPHIFASTVAENVRFARPGATDVEVRTALGAAHLGTWVDALPQGLHTLVGDGHAQLSGGERARLGLARALLADQPVLVLDEPVAHLDRQTAEAVAQDLLDSAGDRTVVWLSHSDVGLDRMDQVVDLGAPCA